MSALSSRFARYAILATFLGLLLAQASSGLSARLSAVLILPGFLIWMAYLTVSFLSRRKTGLDRHVEKTARLAPRFSQEEILTLIGTSIAETVELRESSGEEVYRLSEVRQKLSEQDRAKPSKRRAILEEILDSLGSTRP